MPFVSVRDLGMIGLSADKPVYELPDNAFNDVNNIRFHSGGARKTSVPIVEYTIEVDALWMHLYIVSSAIHRVYATANKLYLFQSGSWIDVTRLSGAYNASYWQSFTWGESVVFNNGVDAPQFKDSDDTEFRDLPNWPANYRCRSMRAYKSFMVAMNITENGVERPDLIMWSSEAESGQPPTDWLADTTNIAGANPIGAEEGAIIDGLELNDSFIIYTLTSATQMQFIGGDFVMAFNRFTDNGIAGINAVSTYDNYHFCVGIASIFVHDGHSVKHVADQKVRNLFYRSTADLSSIKCAHMHSTKEVFIYFNDSGVGAANKILSWCYRYDTWTMLDAPDVTCIVSSADQQDPVTYEFLDSPPVDYFSLLGTSYSQMHDTSVVPKIYMLSSGFIYNYDQEFGAGSDFRIERTGLDFDDTLGLKLNAVKYINQLLPQVKGSGEVTITLGFSDTPEGGVTWGNPTVYDIEKDYKIDVRDSGRYIAWRFEGNTAGAFELSGLDFNIITDGER